MSQSPTTALGKLDFLLTYVYINTINKDSRGHVSYGQIRSYFLNGRMDVEEIGIIIDFLINDGRITEKIVESNTINETGHHTKDDYTGYFISFSGMILIEQGGYQKDNLLKLNQDRHMRIVNYLLALGAIVASIYYVIEVGKWACRFFCHSY